MEFDKPQQANRDSLEQSNDAYIFGHKRPWQKQTNPEFSTMNPRPLFYDRTLTRQDKLAIYGNDARGPCGDYDEYPPENSNPDNDNNDIWAN